MNPVPSLPPRLARAIAFATQLAVAVALLLPLGFAARAAAPPVVTDLGHGSVIVIVPDLGSGRLAWMPVARKLLDHHRVVLVDLPGQGSIPLPDPFSYAAAAAALESILAGLPAESTIVVGHGVGGVVAAYAAQAHPQQMRGLGLVDVPAKFAIPVPDAQRKVFLQWMADNYDVLIARLYAASGPDTIHGKDLLASISLVPRATMTAYLRSALDLNVASALKSWRGPLLYIGSELRWPADRAWSTLASERGLEGKLVEVHRVPACGRWIMKDRPDSLAAAIGAFADRVVLEAPAVQAER